MCQLLFWLAFEWIGKALKRLKVKGLNGQRWRREEVWVLRNGSRGANPNPRAAALVPLVPKHPRTLELLETSGTVDQAGVRNKEREIKSPRCETRDA